MGVRLNTYTDSVEPARALGPCPWDLNRLARDAIQRRGPVQKHFAVHPHTIHSSWFRLSRRSGAPVFCGRACGADAPNYFVRSRVMWWAR